MSKLSISQKLYAGFGIVLLLFIVTNAVHMSGGDKANLDVHRVFQEARSASRAEIALHASSSIQQEFLLTQDLRLVDQFKKRLNELEANARGIAEIGAEFAEPADQIQRYAAQYGAVFESVVALWIHKGLTEKKGLQGGFRNAAHALGDAFAFHEVDSLLTEYLLMRRWEKDFLRTGSSKYHDRLSASMTRLSDLTKKHALLPEAKEALMKSLAAYSHNANLVLADREDSQSYARLRQSAHEIESSIKSNLIRGARADLLQIRRHEKDYLLRGKKKYVTATNKSVQALVDKVENTRLTETRVTFLKELLSDYGRDFNALVTIDRDLADKLTNLASLAKKTGQQIQEVVAQAEASGSRAQEEIGQDRSKTANLAWLLMLPAIGIALAVAFLTTRSLQNSVSNAVLALKKIGQGDFRAQVEIKSNDELGMMAESLNGAIEQIRSTLNELEHSSSEIDQSAHQVAAASQTIQSTSESTSSSVERVTSISQSLTANSQAVGTAISELSASVGEISNNTTFAAGVASRASDLSNEAIQAMVQLGQHSQDIGNILDVISAIAQQTNLLALNATIEAARAGESGKGFAVVANEVKELAGQASNATVDIQKKVEAIQESTDQANSVIVEVAGIVDEINDRQSSIAGAVEQQRAAIEDIGRNVKESAAGNEAITQDLETVSQEVAGAAMSAVSSHRESQELLRAATEMKNIVGKFST